ncbi:MAG: hypothetical protein EOO38_10170 [Cytophagaceae bacterium]|nr:MAG: hypothetical protein EOO38_10170 [Cytophagaceae bacterium]
MTLKVREQVTPAQPETGPPAVTGHAHYAPDTYLRPRSPNPSAGLGIDIVSPYLLTQPTQPALVHTERVGDAAHSVREFQQTTFLGSKTRLPPLSGPPVPNSIQARPVSILSLAPQRTAVLAGSHLPPLAPVGAEAGTAGPGAFTASFRTRVGVVASSGSAAAGVGDAPGRHTPSARSAPHTTISREWREKAAYDMVHFPGTAEPYGCPFPTCGARFSKHSAAENHIRLHRQAPSLHTTSEADAYFSRMLQNAGLHTLLGVRMQPGMK